MTSAPLTQHQDQLTLFAVDSPAKTSAQQGSKPALNRALGLVSFTNSCESFAWFDPDTSSWKTSQRSLLTDWTPFSESWPRQGLTANGRAYLQVLWAPAISATVGGLLPTPRNSSDGGSSEQPSTLANSSQIVHGTIWRIHGRVTVCQRNTSSEGDWKGVGRADQLPTVLAPTGAATYLNPSFVEEMMGFPIGWTV
jgi:hypothetical protein